MSQAGIVDIESSHPQIPTSFVTNSGTAIPIANTLQLLGSAVSAHGIPLQTVGSGNTVTIDVQYASAAASSVAANAGVASFNSADFTVDANGFVSSTGGGASLAFQVDAFTGPGTNPVVATGAGLITVTGGQVAAGTTTNVIRTDSLAANTYTIQVQRSQAVGSSTVGDNGVCHFNSSQFTVDSNGYVSLSGGGGGARRRMGRDYPALGGNERSASAGCVTIGQLGNLDWINVSIGKAGRSRHMGICPHTRAKAMNPINHPLGAGARVAATAGGIRSARPACRPRAESPAAPVRTARN